MYASKGLSPTQQKYCTRGYSVSVSWWKTMEPGMPDVVRRWLLHISTYDMGVSMGMLMDTRNPL
jgi:hypothetical protein